MSETIKNNEKKIIFDKRGLKIYKQGKYFTLYDSFNIINAEIENLGPDIDIEL